MVFLKRLVDKVVLEGEKNETPLVQLKVSKMIDWFKKRKMILRWKLILWSFVCINFGAFMFTVDLNLFTIAFGMLFILWGGWQVLFENID